MNTVLILGAGFSLSASSEFPLTDELGNLAVSARAPRAASNPVRSFTSGYFEAWLSRLAEPQPDLTDAQNASNYAEFLTITKNLHHILAERQLSALTGQPPNWLTRLIRIAHAQKMTLVTFNYDLLVEYAVQSRFVYDWAARYRVAPVHLINGIPPYPPGPGRFAERPAETFDLIKLHGSLDTYWVPGDASGATINRLEPEGTWGRPEPLDEQTRKTQLPGRSPFIIPPAAAKSAFYANPITRELWRSAAEALRKADRVALLGYSLPITDLVTSGMLGETLNGRDVHIDIVNPSPGPIRQRLADIGIDDSHISAYDGTSPIESYVYHLEAEAAKNMLSTLAPADPPGGLMVALGERFAYRVTGLRVESGQVRLTVEPSTGLSEATSATMRHTAAPIDEIELHDLLVTKRDGIVVDYPSPHATSSTVLEYARWQTNIGAGNGCWLILVPTTSPDEELLASR